MNFNLNKRAQCRHLGLIDYQQAWDLQEKLFAEVVAVKVANRGISPESQTPTPNHLLFCEHPHVYTLGKSGKLENLLLNEEGLGEVQASFYKINRGGDITYHGPGQLVGYPILDLDNFFTDIHRYMRTLEEAIIRTLADYGLNAGRIEGLTGVWLDYETQRRSARRSAARQNPRKICALGVKASRWVTMHGFALNVNTDLNYFNHIVPCGIEDKAVTSMQQELGEVVDTKTVEEKLKGYLAELFGLEFI